MINIQYINKTFAVIPIDEYLELMEDLEVWQQWPN